MASVHDVLAKGAAADPAEVVRAIISVKLDDAVVRTAFYAAILGVRLSGAGHHHLSEAVSSCELDLANARVLRLDAERTRQELEDFRSDEVKLRLNKLMTFYSKAASTPYRQGLNEVLAPIMTLRQLSTCTGDLGDLPDGAIYSMLQRLVATFLSAAYSADDGDFVALQCSLQFVRLLLLFHEPGLARVLDQHGVTPELFATPWLVTLFARGLPLEVVFEIWDTLLVNVLHVGDMPASADGAPIRCPVFAGPGLVHFLCIALLKQHAPDIIAAVEGGDGSGAGDFHTHGLKTAELSILISKITLRTPGEARALLQSAVDMATSTPNSVRKALLDAAYSDAAPPQGTLTELEASVCVRVSAAEALARAASGADLSAAAAASPASTASGSAAAAGTFAPDGPLLGPPALLIIDCRPMAEFGVSHIRGSFHLSPDIVSDPTMLTAMADAFVDLTAFQFAVLGAGNSHAELDVRDSDIREAPSSAGASGAEGDSGMLGGIDAAHVVVLFLLNRGFSHVCEVRGGFQAVLQAASTSELLAARLMTSEDPAAGAGGAQEHEDDAPMYDDGSDDDDGEADPDTDAVASSSSSSSSHKASPQSPKLSAAGRAARALRRLSRRPPRPRPPAVSTATGAASARLGGDVVSGDLAVPKRRSRVNSLRSWLSGNASPTVVYTSESVAESPADGRSRVSPPSSAAPSDTTLSSSSGAGVVAGSGRSRAGTGTSVSGRSLSAEISAGTPVQAGLFAGLQLARQRAASVQSVASAQPGAQEAAVAASGRGRKDSTASTASARNTRQGASGSAKSSVQPRGLQAETMGEDEALDSQLDEILGIATDHGPPVEEAAVDADADVKAATGKPAKAATSSAAPAKTGSGGGGWRSALATAAATVSQIATQAAAAPATAASGSTAGGGSRAASDGSRRGSVFGARAGAGEAGLAGGSFADASADVDTLNTALGRVFAGGSDPGAAASAGEDGGARGPGHYHLQVEAVEAGSEAALRVPAGCAIVGDERQWMLRPRSGSETLVRLVGCRRVFADKSVVRRVVLLTPDWICLLEPVMPGTAAADEAAASSAGSSMLRGWAKRAMSLASQALDRTGSAAVRLRLDLIFPSSALKKLGGKKGVKDLAIMDLSAPAHDKTGNPSTSRVVVLCDTIAELVAAIRASRR